jgi:hypothetical protein
MPVTAAERMSFLINCPRCRKATEKSVAWLTTYEALPCATPGCAHMINLKTAENGVLIEMLSDQCADLDAILAKGD